MVDFFLAKRLLSFKIFSLTLIGLVSVVWTADCSGQVRYSAAPKYYPYTIARPEDRTWIRNLPMEHRPNRPLHFYGNRVRRTYSVQRPSYSVQRPSYSVQRPGL